MEATEILAKIAVGGIFGTIGQGLRVVMGLKKMAEKAALEGKKLGDVFETYRFFISLFIGFCSGVLAIFFIDQFQDAEPGKEREQFAALIGIGYAGSDFLEGFISKYIPKSNSATPPGNEVVPASEAGR